MGCGSSSSVAVEPQSTQGSPEQHIQSPQPQPLPRRNSHKEPTPQPTPRTTPRQTPQPTPRSTPRSTPQPAPRSTPQPPRSPSPPPPVYYQGEESEELAPPPGGFDSGHNGSPLTKQDLLQHNQQFWGKSYWHHWKGKVYDVKALCEYYRERLEHDLRLPGKDYGKLHELKTMSHVILLLPLCGIKKTERDVAMKFFYVGPFVAPSAEEKLAEKVKDVVLVKLIFSEEFEENPRGWTPTPSEVQIREICDRELHKAEKEPLNLNQDTNEVLYPLPKGVDADDVRTWLNDYEPFDTELEGCAWGWTDIEPDKSTDADTHEVFIQTVRQWMANWEAFDLEIDGEAGWDVIEEDLVKNDRPSYEQDEILDARANRTDMDDKGRMDRRRLALAAYFMAKYEWPDTKLEPYLAWAQNLEENAQALETLTQTTY